MAVGLRDDELEPRAGGPQVAGDDGRGRSRKAARFDGAHGAVARPKGLREIAFVIELCA